LPDVPHTMSTPSRARAEEFDQGAQLCRIVCGNFQAFMTTFNPLDHPVCLTLPQRIAVSAWIGHVPFGMYLIDVLRPRALAEVGTHYGVSYCAFCQAVRELDLDTRCYAIDSWQGDSQTGFYGPEVLADLEAHHNPLYGGFSRLIQATFDEALTYFPDASFDLLHIDGFHTYKAVKQDFEKWLPKLTARGIILFHDINVREREFGVWKFWDELKLRYPHFEFVHAHGLGVLAVGQDYPAELQALFQSSPAEAAQLRRFFAAAGGRLESVQQLELLKPTVGQLAVAQHEQAEFALQVQERDTLIHELNLQITSLNQQLQAQEARLQEQQAAADAHVQQLVGTHTQQLAERDQQLEERNQQLHAANLQLATHVQQLAEQAQQQQIEAQLRQQAEQQLEELRQQAELQLEELRQQLHTQEQQHRELIWQLEYKERQVQLKTQLLQDRERREQALTQQLQEQDIQLGERERQIRVLSHQLQAMTQELQRKEQLIQAYITTVTDFGRSGSYRLGRALSWPLRALKAQTGLMTDAAQTNGVNQPQPAEAIVVVQPQVGPEVTTDIDAAYDYALWVKLYDTLTDEDRATMLTRIGELEYRPLISIVMPVYNVAEVWLRKAIASVRAQLYPHWELCIADDNSTAPHVRQVLEEYAAKDARIKVTYRQTNGHISLASNSALELATGEFIALLDNDDELPEHALYLVVAELNEHPEADLIFSDEDKIDENGVRREPHFKSDWNPDLFYSCNMISHLGIYRTAIVKKIGGFRKGYEGSQDYDLALRFIEQIPEQHIRHIPRVLYHWRAIAGSVALASGEKNYAHEAAREAIRSHLKRMGVEATVTEGHNSFHRVIYPLPEPAPLISLIIATRDQVELLSQVVDGLLNETDYEPLEIIIINNQSQSRATSLYLRELQNDPRVKVLDYDAPFNYSAVNNLGVRAASGALIGLINNDIKIISPTWLKEMVSHALRPGIGAVGAKLLYPDNTVQHAGVILGVNGVAAHAHRFLPRQSPGYINRAMVIQNLSAVTGACLIMRREIFDEVGGLDEANLPVAFNDVDLCIRLREKGYRIVWTPYAELYHLESASRGSDATQENAPRFAREVQYMKYVWQDVLSADPYYNPNLTLTREDFSLATPPRTTTVWKKAAT
jgi:O-antigen biosynthesis protein